MANLETYGGAVKFMRLRAGQVRSLGGFAFAVENSTYIPARLTSDDCFIFSEKGMGVFPIVIIGMNFDTVKRAMLASDVDFMIDYHSSALNSPSFNIHARKRNDLNVGKSPHVIRDAVGPAVRNVGLSAAGGMGTEGVGEAATALKDAAVGASDAVKGFKSPTPWAGGRAVGVEVFMMGDSSYVETGARKINIKDLARKLFPRFGV